MTDEEILPDFTNIGKLKKVIESDKIEAEALKKRVELGEIKPMKAKTKKINPEKMVDRARKYING